MRKRILIVSQEVFPYISDSDIAESVLDLAKIVKKNPDVEVRLMMPKYGCVNERRHQLHEVIRLSGVNIVVNDIDQPLIVKVASIPQARLQVYFIDNDEYFQRKLVVNEKNNTRKRELMARADAAEREAKRITGRRDFKEIIKAVAQERMKGIYSAFTSENLSPDPAAKAQICTVLKYSPRSERMADMMAARDFTNAPQLEPDIPLVEQLPDPGNPQGVFQLVTMWGLNILFDENGQVNLVAFGQAGYRNGDENEELAAKETAKLRAEGMIRLFINQTVAVQQAAKVGQTVKSFKDAVSKTALNKETMSRMEQKAGFRPINGLKQVIDWNGIHPVTNGGIAGSVVSWNASEAAGALVSKARQNKRVRDRGGVGINRGNDRSLQSAPTRKGGLRGSTRSRDSPT